MSADPGTQRIPPCSGRAVELGVEPLGELVLDPGLVALDGLERGWAHIERATRDGQDREARWNMMSASLQGALAFQKGLGCVHSLSHSLGGVNPRLHHGTLNAILMPLVVRFNAPETGDKLALRTKTGMKDFTEVSLSRMWALPQRLNRRTAAADSLPSWRAPNWMS